MANTKEVGVFVIHGMGTYDENFADKFIKRMKWKVERKGKNPNGIAWESICWSDTLADEQEKYLSRIQGEVDWSGLREFVVSSLGDATAYQKVEPKRNQINTYEQIHNIISEAIKHNNGELKNSSTTPRIILAHSLGGHIISNYIWDRQHPPKDDQLEAVKGLTDLVTFGCNIPLFTFAYNDPTPIDLGHTEWRNYYDEDDVLGYPLKGISKKYKNLTGLADIKINVGGWFTSWNPFSHTGYWADDDFLDPVADLISKRL